ncbi:MAG: DUF4325 domain-containing protein [Candidatus Doudnabacteria bacterium]|nr:DUF4325 domain-containing protein [Candidatus Doudnabacteria bacterium]
MNTRQIIIKLLRDKNRLKTADLVRAFKNGISRQYISKILRELIDEGLVTRIGHTNNAFYILRNEKNQLADLGIESIKKRMINKGIKEHEVLDEINRSSASLARASENVKSIFDYAFSEMLNNVIDHSQSQFVEVAARTRGDNLEFTVRDFGVGVFKNVMRKRKLESELEAIQDILKGKVTTQPHAHSGEGIFFTSKVADIFILESFNFRLRIDNTINDVFIEDVKPSKKGTKVTFIINDTSKKHLNDIFAHYNTNPSDPGFNKTEIRVKLFTAGTIYVSRSQARRILEGLDKFETIVLDYDKVPTIGQAFADEIYRVFQNKHMSKRIESTNMNEAVEFMVKRVDKPKL